MLSNATYAPVELIKSRRAVHYLTKTEINALILEYQHCKDLVRQRDIEEQVLSTHVLGLFNAIKRNTRQRHEETLSLVYCAMKRAMQTYDPKHSASFLTYAAMWARHEVNRSITEEGFDLYRQPVKHHDRSRTIRSLQTRLVQRLGRTPTIDELLMEGAKTKTACFFKGSRPLTSEELGRILSQTPSSITYLDDPFLPEHRSIGTSIASPFTQTLFADLNNQLDGLFEAFVACLTQSLGFTETDIVLERALCDTPCTIIGEQLHQSRRSVGKLSNNLIPRALISSGLPSSELLAPLAAMTALACECLGKKPSRLLQRFMMLNPLLVDTSLDTLALNYNNGSWLDALREQLEQRTKTIDLTRKDFYLEYVTTFPKLRNTEAYSFRKRVAIGKRAKKRPRQLLHPDHLLVALRSTLQSHELQTRSLFPLGRSVLYTLYQNVHTEAYINQLIMQAIHRCDLMLYTNPLQGEALRFWPKPIQGN